MPTPPSPDSPHPPESAAETRRDSARAAGREIGGSSRAERVLRDLLRVDCREVMQDRILRALREMTGAAWAALARAEDGQLTCAVVQGPGPEVGASLASGLPLALEAPGGVRWSEGRTSPEATRSIQLALPVAPEPEEVEMLVLLGPRPDGLPFDAPLAHELSRLVPSLSVALQNATLVDRLRSQALLDPVTNCHNRRAFEEHLRVEIVRARRYRRPLSLMLLDLDAFKSINDELGHQAGDHVLRGVGATLVEALRTTDVVCRYGGDEFAILFPETPRAEVVRLAERLRRQLGGLFPDAVIDRAITASLGVAGYPGDALEAEALVRLADHALYRAKVQGRNRVVAAEPEAG